MKKIINKIFYATKMTVITFAPLWLLAGKLFLIALIAVLIAAAGISYMLSLIGTTIAAYCEAFLQESFYLPAYCWVSIIVLSTIIVAYGSHLASLIPIDKFLKFEK